MPGGEFGRTPIFMTSLPHAFAFSRLVHVLLQGLCVVAQVMLERMQMNSAMERLQEELMVPDGKAPIAAATVTSCCGSSAGDICVET